MAKTKITEKHDMEMLKRAFNKCWNYIAEDILGDEDDAYSRNDVFDLVADRYEVVCDPDEKVIIDAFLKDLREMMYKGELMYKGEEYNDAVKMIFPYSEYGY